MGGRVVLFYAVGGSSLFDGPFVFATVFSADVSLDFLAVSFYTLGFEDFFVGEAGVGGIVIFARFIDYVFFKLEALL